MHADCTTAETFTPIAVAELLDCLCEARDAAARTAASSPAWSRALNTAWGFILEAEALEWNAEAHALRVPSATRAGLAHVANGACSCEAFTKGDGVCWHRAAARLVRRALELEAMNRASEQARAAEELEAEAFAVAGEIAASSGYTADWDECRALAAAELPTLAAFARTWDAAANLGRRLALAAMASPLAA